MTYYLDYQAHTPIDPRVVASLVTAFSLADANPHSTHLHGHSAHSAIEEARADIARLLGARSAEIVITSGATEANNLAFLGVADHLFATSRTHLLVSAIEHPSVLEAASYLGRNGFSVQTVPVSGDGRISVEAVEGMVRSSTGLVSVAWANHEIGTIQPIRELSATVHSMGALFHSDLAQAAGKIDVDVSLLDLASLSAHKLSGPVGIGALYVSRRLRPKLKPVTFGGGQEGGLRSGTVSAPLVVAFGTACRLAKDEMVEEQMRVGRFRDSLLASLSRIPAMSVNGTLDGRLPGNLNVRFEDVDGEALTMAIQEVVSISTGSACSATSLEPSPVLLALGLSKAQAETAVRIGLGRFTTAKEVDDAAAIIESAVAQLRSTRSRV